MTKCVVDILEVVDIAENQRQRAPIACGAFHLARKMLGEKSTTGDTCEVVRRGKLSVLNERNA